MVRELGDEATPALDWDRAEAGLLAKLDAGYDVPSMPIVDEDSTDEVAAIGPSAAEGEAALVERPSLPLAADVADPLASEARLVRESLIDVESLQKGPTVRRAAPRTFTRSAVAFVAALAVAAGVVLGLGIGPASTPSIVAVAEPIDPESLPLAPGYATASPTSTAGSATVRDLGSLKTGDIVEATTGPVAFGRFGVLTWTLSAGGRLSIRSGSDTSQHIVALESGSLRGQVLGDETFIVEVGDTEVATTTGVLFSVTRSSKGLFVDVAEGEASVGALGGYASGTGERQVLRAPHRGKFASDGSRAFELLPDPVATRDEVVDDDVSHARPTAAAAGHEDHTELATRPTRALPATPEQPVPAVDAPGSDATDTATPAVTDASPGATVGGELLNESAVRARIMGCIANVRAEHSTSNDGVSVSVVSTLKLSLDASGAVKGASFNPPLLPEYQSCAVFVLRGRLAPGQRTVSIPFEVR